MHQSPSSATADHVWGVTPQEGVRLTIAYDRSYSFDHENWSCEFTDARWVDAKGRCCSMSDNERDTWRDAAHNCYLRSNEFEAEIREACREHSEVRQQWLRLESGPVDGSCEVEGMPEERRIA